jgi:pimeloyl-ACP methyl ester carboxylesterase
VTTDDGARIYFETFAPADVHLDGERPHDRRPVLLVMGLGANGRLWAPAVRRYLAAGYPVITLDNRGCGRSSTPLRPWTTRTIAADSLVVLNELGVEQAHVCGASLGGMAAQELALRAPKRVRTLVLAATTGGFRRLESAAPRTLLHTFEVALRFLRPSRDAEHRIRDFLRTAASEDFAAQCRHGDESWDAVAAMLEDPATQRGVALQFLAALRHSTWSRLPRLRMPVLIHHGSEDPLIPLVEGRELARRIPGARFEIHRGAGHGMLECTDEVAESILAFLTDRETSGSPDQAAGATRPRSPSPVFTTSKKTVPT